MAKQDKFASMFRRQTAAAPVESRLEAAAPAPYPLSTLVMSADLVELPPEAAQLSDDLQGIARQFITSKRRIGEEIRTAARLINEARQRAEHGDWLMFLRVTNTGEDTAERLLNIHTRAEQLSAFGDAIVRGWLTESTAWRLARPSTPDAIIEQVLAMPEPPSVRELDNILRQVGRNKRTTPRHTEGDRDGADEQIPPRGGISDLDQPINGQIPPRGGILMDTKVASSVGQWDQEDSLNVIEPIAPEMRAHIPALIELVERYVEDPQRLSAEDWTLLAPLALRLSDLLRRLDRAL